MKNIAFYPCKLEHIEYLEYLYDEKNNEFNVFIGYPQFWEKPIINRDNVNYFNDLFDEKMNLVDEIYILNVEEIPNILEYLISYFEFIKTNNQDLIIRILSKDSDLLKGVANYDFLKLLDKKNFKFDVGKSKLYKSNSIIIGMGKILSAIETDKFLFQILKNYEDAGFNVKVISHNPNNSILKSFVPFPKNFMNESNERSILLLNEYIEFVESKFNPDIIIIDFPKSIIKFSDHIFEDFGISSFIITQSMEFDYFFTIGTLNINDFDLIENLNEVFSKKLGVETDCFLLQNYFLDLNDVAETQRIGFRKNMDMEFERKRHDLITIVKNKSDLKKSVDQSIKKLISYACNL